MKKIISIFAVILFVFPFLYAALLSVSKNIQYPALLPHDFSFSRWVAVFNPNNGIASGFFLSMIIAFSVASLSTTVGFIISRAISSHRYKKILLYSCYFPLALSPVIFASVINFYFVYAGLSGTIAGVILAQLFISVPFSIILLSSFWTTQIASLQNTSYTLGAGAQYTFFKVLLPVARPALLVCLFQTFLISWFEYGLTSITGVGKVQTLTLKVFQYINEANIYYAALSSCIIILPVALLLLWANKKFIVSKIY